MDPVELRTAFSDLQNTKLSKEQYQYYVQALPAIPVLCPSITSNTSIMSSGHTGQLLCNYPELTQYVLIIDLIPKLEIVK